MQCASLEYEWFWFEYDPILEIPSVSNPSDADPKSLIGL